MWCLESDALTPREHLVVRQPDEQRCRENAIILSAPLGLDKLMFLF